MSQKSLLIVESPTKIKTIQQHLGNDYEVISCVGHVKDLPSNELGIDPPSTPPVMLTPKVEKQATASILIATGTASNLNNEYITIKDAFGKTVKYIFRNDSNETGVVGGRFKSTYSETDDGYPGGEVYVDIYGITASAASFAEYLLTTIIGDLGHDGRIQLQFPIDGEPGRACTQQFGGLSHLVHHGVFCGPLGGEGKHGAPRGTARQSAMSFG